jgi:hypothetical protein
VKKRLQHKDPKVKFFTLTVRTIINLMINDVSVIFGVGLQVFYVHEIFLTVHTSC